MDVVKAVETYVNKMVSTPDAIKVLLLDSHTVRRTRRCVQVTAANKQFAVNTDTNSILCIDTEHLTFSSGILNGQN